MKNIWNKQRHLVQIFMGVFLLYIGMKFYQFAVHVQSSGKLPFASRPAAVEGFLPISALLAFKQWLFTGIYDPIHPAGLTIFLAIILTAFIFKKSFCSWLCPIGTIAESLSLLGEKLFGKNINIPKWLDIPLMGLKYLLLGFFLKVIFFDMPLMAVHGFLNSPYNKVADIKMMYFFLDISKTAFIVLLVLLYLSLFIKLFWCRYLCPYGALQGIISIFSIFKVKRDNESCTNCGLCNKSCPAMIKVSQKETISSPECTGCLNCIESCPVENCLKMNIVKTNFSLTTRNYALLFLSSFFLVIFIAKLTGNWETNISLKTFYQLAPNLDMFGHP